MIKTRVEIKTFKIWLICLTLFLWAVIIASPFLGLMDESMLYRYLPFLDFGLTIEGSIAGWEIPASVSNNFSFALGLLCLMAAVLIAVLIVYFCVKIVLASQRSKAKRILKETGYSGEYFSYLEKKRKHLRGGSLEALNDLAIAKQYCDGRRYDTALEILRNADIDNFKVGDAAEYYSLYSYIFILSGNLGNAEFAMDLVEQFNEKLKDKSRSMFVNALLLYAKADYDGAESAFLPILKSKNTELRIWSGMYLGLIYLRKHRTDDARRIVVTLSKYKKSPRQSEDILKLLKKIETAYALEKEEQELEQSEQAS